VLCIHVASDCLVSFFAQFGIFCFYETLYIRLLYSFVSMLHMAKRCLVSTDCITTGGPNLLILRLSIQVVDKFMEGADSIDLILFHGFK
jgi:hypothetical protein